MDPESLDISVVQDQLTIAGEKPATRDKVEAEAYHRGEREAGRFVRTLRLPFEVDQDKATAEFKNGLLKLTLPKAESARPKQIAVNVG